MMNKSLKIVFFFSLMACMGTSVAQVVLKQAPLDWEDTANLGGGALYNNLCASCHGVSGAGDGPAAGVLHKDVPDLRLLTIDNDGVYSHKKIERSIRGSSRDIAHGTIDMPDWEQQFMYVNPGWSTFTREAYARRNIKALVAYIETLQLNVQPDRVAALDH